jgi:LIVCS family branched-chain amino acid:cation transporter
MEKLSRKNQLLIGVTLFSMFFGAGNLIFPPLLGYQAGQVSLAAFLGFAISAIGLPILGVAAVARAGDLPTLAGRASKPFAAVFTVLIYLSIGPCLAIPRTASTSFEMAVTPFLPESAPVLWLRAAYSAVFFGVALALALHPTKLVDWLGKRLAPVLLALIAVLFVGCVVVGFSGANAPVGKYAAASLAVPAVQGFLDGYQTMDAIAALIFGIVLAMNIRTRGVTQDDAVVKTTIRAGWVAAALFAAVYGALTWIGTVGGYAYGEGAQNGAEILTFVAKRLYGTAGQIILAAIFVIACLNTCVGLICCCAEYFHSLFSRISYTGWAVIFAVFSGVVANAGLNMILKVSVPVLGCLYPVAIVLIGLAFLPKNLHETRPLLYPLTVALAGVTGVVASLSDAGLKIPGITALFEHLPLYGYGLSWLLPALVGLVVGLLVKREARA